MRKWVCPKCSLLIETSAVEVVHRCPSNKSKLTHFETKEENEQRDRT